jgi:vacuolar-type H+-ATPase subunit H
MERNTTQQEYDKNTTRIRQEYDKNTTRIRQECDKNATRILQERRQEIQNQCVKDNAYIN